MNLRTWIIPENMTLAKAEVITQRLFWISLVLFCSSVLLNAYLSRQDSELMRSTSILPAANLKTAADRCQRTLERNHGNPELNKVRTEAALVDLKRTLTDYAEKLEVMEKQRSDLTGWTGRVSLGVSAFYLVSTLLWTGVLRRKRQAEAKLKA